MKKSISKSAIIKAITNEPLLRRGYWFKRSRKTGTVEKDCAVCAVGSILRAMSFEKWGRKEEMDLNHLGNLIVGSSSLVDDYMVDEHLANKNYLAALSCYYESGNSRLKCIKFIKDKFPAKITIEI